MALTCLNELVADALELVPDSLGYLGRLRTPAIYRFCAITQVMAMATLGECFDNPLVFTGVVKIRKGLTARLIIASIDGPDAVHWWFSDLARQILERLKSGSCAGADGPIGERLEAACRRIREICHTRAAAWETQRANKSMLVVGTVTAGLAAALAVRRKMMT